jgi:hypothetical protein
VDRDAAIDKRIPHRLKSLPKVHECRLAAIAEAVAQVIEEDDLVSSSHEWRHEAPQLRTPATPAVTKDDGGSRWVADTPRRELAEWCVDRHYRRRGDQLLLGV